MALSWPGTAAEHLKQKQQQQDACRQTTGGPRIVEPAGATRPTATSITQKAAKSNPLLVGANISGIRSYRFLIYLNQFKVFNDGRDLIQNLGVTKVLKSRAQFNLGLQFYIGASFYSQVLEFPPSQDQCEKVVIFYQRWIFYSPFYEIPSQQKNPNQKLFLIGHVSSPVSSIKSITYRTSKP